MGIFEKNNLSAEDNRLNLDLHAVHAVISKTEIAAADLGGSDFDDFAIVIDQLSFHDMVSEDIIDNAQILVLEVSPAEPDTVERIQMVRLAKPDLPVIAAIRNADISFISMLMKQGISDVISLPLSGGELAGSLRDIFAKATVPEEQKQPKGKLISFIKSLGGVGATTVATHVADALTDGEDGRKRVCLFDFDMQFGSVATYMGMSNALTLGDLLEAGHRVDGEFLKSVAYSPDDALYVIPSPTDILPLESIDESQLLRIIEVAQREFDYVVVDLPANWTNWVLSTVARSDVTLLVATLSIASLTQSKRQIGFLESHNIDSNKVVVVANRLEKRLFKSIELDDASQALGCNVELGVHNDYSLVSAANNQGILIQEMKPKSKLVADYRRIAGHVRSLVMASGE